MTKKTIKSVLATVMACGMAFAFVGCAHVHTFDESKWEYNATKHWNPSICEHEELGTIGKNSSVHTYAEGDTCDVCGYEREHVHRFDTTTWESDETDHWRPVTCGHTDAVEKTAHGWGTSYTSVGADGHTQTCNTCGSTSAVQAHVFDNDADTSCNSRNCGYTRTIATPDPDPNPNPNPDPAPAAGASKLPDAHQGTQEKDASWARYTLPLRAEPGSNDLANYVVIAGATASVPSEGADGDGYNGVGGFRAAYGATITITVNASAACEAGLYFEMSARTSDVMMGSLFRLAVNGKAVDVSAVKLQTTEGTDNAPANYYTFCGYVNLNAGANTIVLTRTETTVSGGAFNFWGVRLTAQSATITAATSAAAAEVAMLPNKDN